MVYLRWSTVKTGQREANYRSSSWIERWAQSRRRWAWSIQHEEIKSLRWRLTSGFQAGYPAVMSILNAAGDAKKIGVFVALAYGDTWGTGKWPSPFCSIFHILPQMPFLSYLLPLPVQELGWALGSLSLQKYTQLDFRGAPKSPG